MKIVPLFVVSITCPPWSAEMMVGLSSLKHGGVDNFKSPWEARLWSLGILAS